MNERRRSARVPYTADFEISWNDGADRSHAKALDISTGGLRLEVPTEIPVNTNVTLRSDSLDLTLVARVCYAAQKDSSNVIGLQLSKDSINEVFGFLDDEKAV